MKINTLIAALTLTVASGYSLASDVINMGDYYPVGFTKESFRRADESLFSTVLTKPVDTILAYHGTQPAGGVNFTQEYYYTKEHHIPEFIGDDPDTCFRTARSFRKDIDGGVYELGGSPRRFNLPCKTGWTAGSVVTYRKHNKPIGLPWGRPGYNSESDPYFGIFNMNVLIAERGQKLQTIGLAFATHHMDAHHNEFTPEYGRNAEGVWGKGNAFTYQDVVEVTFIHGTSFKSIPNKACSNRPDLHIAGYNSFYIKQWIAKGVGIVQEHILFIENAEGVECKGTFTSTNPNQYQTYIDQ